MKMTLGGGTLKLQPAITRIGDGTVRTDLSLYGSETPVRVDVDTRIDRVNLKELLRGSSFAQLTAGILGGRARVRATGASVAQILGTADGNLFMVTAGGKFSHLMIELAGLDIAESLGFAVKGDEPIPIRCIVADLLAQRVHDAEPDLRHHGYDHSGTRHDQYARGNGGRDADSATQGLQPSQSSLADPLTGHVRGSIDLHRPGAPWREHDDQEDRRCDPDADCRTAATHR
jgi:hypothetical protein